MAILKGILNFSGSLGNLSAYNMRGTDKVIIRSKGGATKKQIAKLPSFKQTRENYSEFSGCAKLASSIRRVLLPVTGTADFNFTPQLSRLAKIIQLEDSESERGKRGIYLSRHKQYLNGFSLNRKTDFGSIVRYSLSCSIDRENKRATVELPDLVSGVNLITGDQSPLFRFVICLGTVSDRIFSSGGYLPGSDETQTPVFHTGWQHISAGFSALTAVLQLDEKVIMTDDVTLVLAMGIEMGVPITPDLIKPVRYAGAAKIIGVG